MSRTADKPKAGPAPKPAAVAPAKPKESTRDLVEQLVVAFILAVLIKGFEAEAFVIPTGSMAPTLYGQHKEVTCPYCDEVFAVNASEEAESARWADASPAARANHQVAGATCINCRGLVTDLEKSPSFKGDRILVMKFLYSLPTWLFGEKPSRWDVVVFHYPEEPETNYIKRLVGLPGEILRVYFGDVLTRPLGSDGPFRMLRKPLEHQQAMQQLVWNDAHRPRPFASFPAWNRWKADGTGATEPKPGAFRLQGAKAGAWAGLRYRHLVPDPSQWEKAKEGHDPGTPRASLIGDFYAYNTGVNRRHLGDGSWFAPHWVGDLTVSARVRAEAGSGGTVRLDLVEGGVLNRCEVDLKTGRATISHGGKPLGEPASSALRDDGQSHEVAFANVDDRLTLWVDGRTPFGEGLTYDDGVDKHPAPTSDDLSPVALHVGDGGSVEVSGLVLKRDIYYTQDPGVSDYAGLSLNWPSEHADGRVSETLDVLADPSRFPLLGDLKSRDFPIQPGRYMMMGDNSPRSKDGRGWRRQDVDGYYDVGREARVEKWAEPDERDAHEVPESLLIGKAFFVYWPHGVPFWPNVPITRDFRVPFRPYFERMKWIR